MDETRQAGGRDAGVSTRSIGGGGKRKVGGQAQVVQTPSQRHVAGLLALQVVRDHPPHVGGIPGGLLHGLLDAAGGNGPGYVGNVFLALGDRPAAVPLLLLFGEDGVGDHELGLLAFLDVCRGAHVLQASGGQLGVCDVLVIVVVIVIEEDRRQDITVVEVVLRHGLDGPDDLLLAGRVVVGSSVRRREFCGGQLYHGRDEVDSGAIVEGEASSTSAGIDMSLCLGVNDVVSIAVRAVAAAGKFTERWPCCCRSSSSRRVRIGTGTDEARFERECRFGVDHLLVSSSCSCCCGGGTWRAVQSLLRRESESDGSLMAAPSISCSVDEELLR